MTQHRQHTAGPTPSPQASDPVDAAIARIFERMAAEEIPARFSELTAKLGDERGRTREK
jgi:hypothetical protein